MPVAEQYPAQLIEHQVQEPSARWRAAWKRVLTHTHTFSGREDHGGAVPPPTAYARLARWAAERGVDAVGMGSPYTPEAAAAQQRYDGPQRDRYYEAGFDRQAVRQSQLEQVRQMLERVAACAENGTLFYLDNETPKGRFGHMWWVGYHADEPPWHDYDQDFDRWMLHRSVPGDDSAEPMPYTRRPYTQIVAIQRGAGALGYWAHPTSWWRDGQGRFITNIASELPAHLIAEGFADGMVVMGYQAYRPAYLALWHKLLDAGFRLPGVAEMDVGLSCESTWQRRGQRVLLNQLWLGEGTGRPAVDELTRAFASGRLVASSGPVLDLTVDGHAMGQVAPSGGDVTHQVELTACAADGDQRLGRVELRGPGEELLWAGEDLPGGRLRLALPGMRQRGYVTARAFGAVQGKAEGGRHGPAQVAISNPVYFHPPGEGFEKPMPTRVRVAAGDDSPFAGATVRFETAGGELLEKGRLTRDGAEVTMPAHGRVTCVDQDGRSRTLYLITANERLMEVQRYLYRGRFLRDFPNSASGVVPPEAWRLEDYRRAMERVTLRV